MIEIFTSKYCQNCKITKQIFARKGYDFIEHDIEFSQSVKQSLYDRVAGNHAWSIHWQSVDDVTVPVVFIGEECMGTIESLYKLIEVGKFNETIDAKIAFARLHK